MLAFRTPKVLLILLLLPLLACTRTETAPVAPLMPDLPTTTQPITALSDIAGLWVLEKGSMMSDFVQGLATFSVTADVTAVEINTDGTGNVWLRDRLTGTNDCVRVFVIFDDDSGTLAFDFAAEPTTDVVYNVALEKYTYVFPLVTANPSWLGIADEAGRIALFSRQTMLPAGLGCSTLQVLAQYDVPSPQFFSDLVHYGDNLIFNGGATGKIEAFSLTTKTLGLPIGVTNGRLVQTAEGGFFWTHCGCGGSRDAFKHNNILLFDTVSSESDMGGAITFRAMAYDAMADRLWLHGRPFDDSSGRFYVMNTNGEPDVVESTLSFNRDLRALTFDGNNLWGIVTVATQTLVRIDPASGQVLESYEVPDPDVSWAGLEIVAGTFYFLGTDLDGNGVIYETNIPPVLTGIR